MNIAYYRKSTFDLNKTVENVKKTAEKLGLSILSTADLPDNMGAVINICNQQWMKDIITSDRNLIGLLPCSVVVLEKDKEVSVGVGNPSILGDVTRHPTVTKMASIAEETLKNLINESAGVGELKAKSVKLYSTTSCPYCTMEAKWLDENGIKYEKVNVDLDQQAAEEMVRKTGQMGVPVTTVEFEEGDEEHIVGFDKQKLSSYLGLKNN